MTLVLNQVFNTDREKEEQGVWKDIGSGAKVKVARAMNDSYRKLRDQVRQENALAIRYNTLTKDEELAIDIDVEAKTVFLDFKGISLNPGDPELENTLENRKILLQNKDLRGIIIDISFEIDNFKRDEEDAEKK